MIYGPDGRPLSNVGGDVAHDAVDSGNPAKMGGFASASAPTAVTADGDRVNAWLSRNGAQNVILRDTAGVAIATGAQYVEDSALGSTPQGTVVMARRDDALAALTPVEDDAISFRVNNRGALWVATADNRFASVTVATTASTTLVAETNGANHAIVRIGTSTTGTFHFEVTLDGTNWVTAEAFKANGDLWVSGVPQTPTSGDAFRVLTAGYTQVRATVDTTLGATVAMLPTLVYSPLITGAANTSASPHAHGQNELSAGEQFTAAQTSHVIGPTVTSTQRMVVTYIQIGAGGTVAATQVSVYFGTTTFTRGTSRTLFDHELAPSATLKPGFAMAKPNGWIGAADEELRITSVGAANPLTITFWYYLIGI